MAPLQIPVFQGCKKTLCQLPEAEGVGFSSLYPVGLSSLYLGAMGKRKNFLKMQLPGTGAGCLTREWVLLRRS